MKFCTSLSVLFILVLLSPLGWAESSNCPDGNVNLNLGEGWALESSAKVTATGEIISTPGFQATDWYPADVPATVLAALVKDKVYPDPNFGLNLLRIPGADYSRPILSGVVAPTNLSDLSLQPGSPFSVAWWYRKSFLLPLRCKGKTIWLNFSGINYRANIWVNGNKITGQEEVAGAWRAYEFNITDVAHFGDNAIAVEVFPPTQWDLSISFVDWNPTPPDRDMGFFGRVYIRASGSAAIRYPAVIPHLDLPGDHAEMTVAAQLVNGTDKPLAGTLKGRIGAIEFSEQVQLKPRETKQAIFEPSNFPQLKIGHPRLWWPAQMGTPNLYELRMELEVDGAISDKAETHFGIREVTSEVHNSARVFSVNGKRLLIRGAGWAMDMMLRQDSQRMQDEFRYVADMGLNTIRLEGMLETDEFFDLADQEGILVMAGWSCSLWEPWSKWKKEEWDGRYSEWMQHDFKIAEESERSQILRLRNHPSVLMWTNGSDNPPPPEVERMYLKVEQDYLWPNPTISSVTSQPTPVSGATGVKETGPYEWVAPTYWLEDTDKEGGAFGFNTETSPGPAVPPVESLRLMLPEDHMWPMDDWWDFHAGLAAFKDIHVFADALAARYGRPSNVEDFAFKSQLMGYEGIRAMFEAYSRNKYTATGVIQWMLNNAWPSTIWHLYDFYLRPGGGYFGAKRALEPLHPLYSHMDHSVWLVSSQYTEAKGLTLTTKVYNLDMEEKFSNVTTLDAPADSTKKLFTLPTIDGLTPVYFLRLTLENAAHKFVSSNFYWISRKPEVLDWQHSQYPATPTASYADYTALHSLPKVKLEIRSHTERRGEDAITHVTVENRSKQLAFFIRLKASNPKDSVEILPVLWQDNYFSLMPGEKREVTAEYHSSQLESVASPVVSVSGWNVSQ